MSRPQRHRATHRAAGRTRRPAPAGLLALAVATVLAGLAWLLWPAGVHAVTPAPATVLEPASCAVPGGRDIVSVELDGRSVRAELDGCGHRAGARLTVEVPGDGAAAVRPGMTVQLAGTGTPARAVTAQRAAAVLLALAGAAGAVLGWRVRSRPG